MAYLCSNNYRSVYAIKVPGNEITVPAWFAGNSKLIKGDSVYNNCTVSPVDFSMILLWFGTEWITRSEISNALHSRARKENS